MNHTKSAIGYGSIDEAAAVIESLAKQRKMLAHRESAGPGSLRIYLTQTAPWYRILLNALPQRVCWTLVQVDETCHITCHTRFFPWYFGLTVLLCASAAIVFVATSSLSLPAYMAHNEPPIGLSCASLMLSFLTLFAGFRLLTAPLDGVVLHEFWTAIQLHTDSQERPLLRFKTMADRRQAGLMGVRFLVLFSLVVTMGVFGFALRYPCPLPIDMPLLGILILLFVMIAGLLISLRRMLRSRSARDRLLLAIPGASSWFAMLLLVAAQLPWGISHELGRPENVSVVRSASTFLTARPTEMPATEYEQKKHLVAAALDTASDTGRVFLFISVLLVVASIVVFLVGLKLSLSLSLARKRLFDLRGHPSMRPLASGRSIVGMLRSGLLLAWTASALLLLPGIAFGLGGALHCLIGPYPGEPNNIAAQSANAAVLQASAAFGHPEGHRTVEIFIRCIWVLYSSACCAALALSLGQYARKRRRILQRLCLLAATTPVAPERASVILTRLASSARCPLPRLVFGTEPSEGNEHPVFPFARSYQFGVLRRQRFIEISPRCLLILNDDELEGLLAHEIAHFVSGHVSRDNLLQILGRVTFVGDQTMRVFQETFGYELKADRTAITMLGVHPSSLIRCMWKMRHVAAAEGIPALSALEGMPFASARNANSVPTLRHGLKPASFRERWRLSIRLFLQQYTSTCDEGSLYWHPSIKHRVRELRKIVGRVTSPSPP